MKKWKFCFYTAANYEKAELFLAKMEIDGYRLEKRRLIYFFKFKEASKKDVKYFLIYSPVGSNVTMYDLEMQLQKEYNASIVVEQGLEAPKIYRICNTDKQLSSIKNKRNILLKRECVNKCVTTFLFALVMEFLFITFKGHIGNNWLIHLALTLPIAAFSIYNFIDFLLLSRKNRKTLL